MDKLSKYLFDIQHSIESIELFLTGTEHYETYLNDLKTRSAVERQLAIIGEAVNMMKKQGAELKNARQIIDFRNRLIHSYDNIDSAIVWAIIKRHLPELKREIEELTALRYSD